MACPKACAHCRNRHPTRRKRTDDSSDRPGAPTGGGTAMKLLIVEDEAKLADYLRKGLVEEGYVVEVTGNGIDGLHMATEGSHDLIVLDTMLPGIDSAAIAMVIGSRHRIRPARRKVAMAASPLMRCSSCASPSSPALRRRFRPPRRTRRRSPAIDSTASRRAVRP